MLECSEQSNLIFNTIFRHDNHLLMAKYGLGCQAQAFQSILERGRCSTCSTAFCLSGELWNTSPTYRCLVTGLRLIDNLSPFLCNSCDWAKMTRKHTVTHKTGAMFGGVLLF